MKTAPAKLNNLAYDIKWISLFVVAVFIFLLFTGRRLEQTVPADDLWILEAAQTYYEAGVPKIFSTKFDATPAIYFHHPYLYLQLLWTLFSVFGSNFEVARFVGIAAIILSAAIVFCLTRFLSPRSSSEAGCLAALTASAYLLAPATIQGSLFIQTDCTILVPCILMMTAGFAQYCQDRSIWWGAIAVIGTCLSFWVRISTPFALLVLLGGYALVSRQRWYAAMPLLLGVLLFLFSWHLYCRWTGLDIFAGPILYTFRGIAGKTGAGGLKRLSIDGIQVILWTGAQHLVIFLIVFLKQIGRLRRQRQCRCEDILLGAGLFLFLGYMVVGGLPFGYPRYQAPAIPMLYVAAAVTLAREPSLFHRRLLTFIAIAGAAIFLIQLFVAGDLIYQLRFALRHALAFEQDPGGVIQILSIGAGAVMIGTALSVLAGWCWHGSKSFLSTLVVSALAAQLSMTILQGTADYNTGFIYGCQGTSQVVSRFRPLLENYKAKVIVPREVAYYLNSPQAPYRPDSTWYDAQGILQQLKNDNVVVFGYNIALQTIDQVRAIRSHKGLQAYLAMHFTMSTIGNYNIWSRYPEP